MPADHRLNIEQLAQRLSSLRTPEQIREFRRRLDRDTAHAVIRALSPVERGAVLLCLQFASNERFPPFDSRIDVLTPEELAFLEIPCAQSTPGDGQSERTTS